MLEFKDLKLPQHEGTKEEPSKHRFIIGYDPFEDTKTKPEGKNVFIVYDKGSMRNTTRVLTSKNFDQFTEWLLAKEESKRMFTQSKKFIDGTTGRPKTLDQIRSENTTSI